MKHRKALSVLSKITKSVVLRQDGLFSYSTGKPFNPADTVVIDNIKADHNVKNYKEEYDSEGRLVRISGEVG